MKFLVVPGFVIFAVCCFCPDGVAQSTVKYQWYQANTGGGGYITGLVQHEQSPDILYARCDVGGVFRTRNKGGSWKACNNGLSRWYHHSVQSIAADPSNGQTVFRCSGDMRNDTLFGSIHKSVDGGDSWYEVSNEVAYYGNGETRMFGELIAVDPFDPRFVITGGYARGLFTSRDRGETWAYRTGKEECFITVAINPYHPNWYFASARSGNIYLSRDKGQQWTRISEADGPNSFVTEFAFDAGSPDVVYCSATDGVYKSEDACRTFRKSMAGLPGGMQYNTIVSHPDDTRLLFTAPDARPNHSLTPVPVYQSRDGGLNWSLIADHAMEQLKEYPSYIKSPQMAGWAIAKVRVDRSKPMGLIFTNWYGVSFSSDRGLTYSGKNFRGLETNCLENILYHPLYPDVSYYTLPDHMPMVSRDGGENYVSFPRTAYSSSTAIAPSRHDSTLVLFGARDRHKDTGAVMRMVQNETEETFSFEKGFVQNIREDPHNKGVFYMSIDGDLSGAGGVYKSVDWGKTWAKMSLPFPSGMKTLPHRKQFIENELLNVVTWQKKNVCGTNQLMCVDPHTRNTVYFGEWTAGLFKSDDGGRSWTNVCRGLPFGRDTASVLTVIRVDPKIRDRIYAGFIKEGLWRSDDGGKSWRKVFPQDQQDCNVSTLYVGGMTGKELFVAGENLYWSKAPVAVWHSRDAGLTWVNIYDLSLGALRIKGIDYNPETGRIVMATSGNGAFYADP